MLVLVKLSHQLSLFMLMQVKGLYQGSQLRSQLPKYDIIHTNSNVPATPHVLSSLLMPNSLFLYNCTATCMVT